MRALLDIKCICTKEINVIWAERGIVWQKLLR